MVVNILNINKKNKMTARTFKKQLLKDIQTCVEKDEDKHNRIDELHSEIEQLKNQKFLVEREEVWVGMPRIYKALTDYLSKHAYYETIVKICGTHKIPNIELLLELVIDWLNSKISTSLSYNERMMYESNIRLVQKYVKNGCPEYVKPSTFVAIGYNPCL